MPNLSADEVSAWRDSVGDLGVHRLGEGGDHGDTGEPIEPLHTAAEVGVDEQADLGLPGRWPFTRGAYPAGYRRRPWLFAQYTGLGTAAETNHRWKALLAAGQRSVSLAVDLPTHLGLDSDHPLAEDEVGKAGVAVDSLADFEVLFDGIDLATTPATFNTAAAAPMITALYQVTGKTQGVPAGRLRGTVTNDPLSSSFRGTCVLPAEHAVRIAGDLIEFCIQRMPSFTPINVQGVYMRSVGATKAQEVGYAFAVALAYLDEVVRRGIPVADAARRFSFFFQCDSHFFEEAAKFRAARKVWAELVRSRYGTDDPDAQRLRATGVSAARCFTKEEPEINLIRGAYSALGCALGGVQGMWVSSYDEAYATPTERASRLALRTMQILAEETGVRASIDPLGGGYYIEYLTGRMTQLIREHVQEVEDDGGTIAAVDSGTMRRRMLDNDMRWLQERESGQRVIVAHNAHRLDQDQADDQVEFQRYRPEVLAEQIARLREVRARRDEVEVKSALAAVQADAASGANVMPALCAALERSATVGEVMDQFRAVFGEWTEPDV